MFHDTEDVYDNGENVIDSGVHVLTLTLLAPRHTFQMGGCALHVRSTPLLTILAFLAYFFCYRIIAGIGMVPFVFDHGPGYINTFTWLWPSKIEKNISKEPPSVAPWLRKPLTLEITPLKPENPPRGQGPRDKSTAFESLTKIPQSKLNNFVVY